MRSSFFSVTFALTLVAVGARAQSTPDEPPPTPPPAPPPARLERFQRPPPLSESAPPEVPPEPPPPAAPPPEAAAPPEPERMSEGRSLVSLYNKGFQWGVSPGVVVSSGNAGFYLGARAGYGVDMGRVILVPGVQIAGYFTDPSVYIGMPVARVVFPVDRFGPFVEAGAGIGNVTDPSKSGLALMGGGGVVAYFTSVAVGAEASYQIISGTGFQAFTIGPVLALAF